MKKQVDFLSGLPMTMLGGVFLLLSFVLPRVGIALPIDPAWITVIVSGIPLLYLAVWRILHNPGISKISSALLITIAMFAAIAIGDLFAAGEVAWIMAIGAILEDMTTNRARKGLKKWIHLTPTQGRRIRGGEEELVSPEQIQTGDILRILPGETVPVDGVIIRGETSVDQSILTGESLPLDKGPGEEVFCGTINRFGSIDIRATKVGEDSSLQKLIRMVQEAEKKQAPMQRIADRCASWLVPAALLIAIATGLIKQDLIPAVTVLVVFCPCALVLATPTAIMAAIGNATRHGFLVREGDALERLAAVSKITFDKTGTLTYGTPRVVKAQSVTAAVSDDEVYALCAAAEQMSEHPLGKAVVRCYRQEIGGALDAAEAFTMLPGRGVMAQVKGASVLAGNRAMLIDHGIVIPPAVEAQVEQHLAKGCTVMYVAVGAALAGFMVLSDTVREQSAAMIDRLTAQGVQPVLLTGDHQSAATAIAQQLHIEEVHAGCLPEDKLAWIRRYQEEQQAVCMIGDGVNDAPALKAADVGIAMGGAGSDLAVDAADIALVDDEVNELPHLVALSKRMMITIKVNMSFSMGLNFLAIVLAMVGTLNPVVGALVHNAGSVLVIAHSAWLLKWRKKQ